jgi:hypothetical protein
MAVVCLIATGVVSAQASAVLTLNDGIDPSVSITDNAAGDLSPTAGVISWSGSFGAWTFNFDVGESKPFLGDTANPQMFLNFIANSSVAGNLTVTLSDSGFSPVGSSALLELGAGGTLADGASVTVSGLLNGSKVVGGGPFVTSAWNSNAGALVNGLSSFSLQEVVVLTHGANGGVSSGSVILDVVPEPATTSLLMFGAGALWILRKKKTA